MATSFQLQLDVDNERIYMIHLKPDGTVDATKGIVDITLLDTDGRELSIRPFYFKDADDSCKRKLMYILASAPEDAP